MNDTNNIIHNLHTNMVEWVSIGELCKTITPPKKIPTKNYEVFGKYPIIDQGQQSIIGYTNDKSSLVPNDEYVLFGDHTRYVKYHKGSFAQGADGLKILKVKDTIIPRYFFYAFLNTDIPTRGYSRHWSIVKALLIPIPSLAEQNRIVGILDTFTESIENIKKQIQLRKKQYEFYRDKLLDLEGKPGICWKKLNSICGVINGRAYKQSELLTEGKYKVLRVGNFFSNDNWYYSDLELDNKYYCFCGDLLYAWSASFGPHIWKEDKTIYHYHIWKMNCSNQILIKYMFYWLQSDNMRKQAFSHLHGSTMAHLTKALIESLLVPVPSLAEQSRIVSILDQFESSISNLEHQLSQRQKQYEYYRNKLLTFE